MFFGKKKENVGSGTPSEHGGVGSGTSSEQGGNRKYYTFQAYPGIRFYQEDLDFDQDMAIKKILKSALIDISDDLKIMQVIDILSEKGYLPEALEVILRVEERHPLTLALSREARARERMRKTINIREMFGKLKNSEIAEVLGDFFVLNTAWLGSALGSLMNSLSTEKKGPVKTISDLMSCFTPQPTVN